MIIIPDKLRRPAEVEREELRKQLSEAGAEIEQLKAFVDQRDRKLKELLEEPMNRKRRNNRKSILFIREQDPDTLYQERRYADQPRGIPFKDWVKRLARVHRHDRPAAVRMFEARFGELEAPPLFKAICFLNRMYHYRRTGFISPVLMLPAWIHRLFPVTQSNTGDNQGE